MTHMIQGSATSAVKASYWYPDGESSASGGVVYQSSAVLIDSAQFTHLFCAFANLDARTNRVYISGEHDYEFSTFTDTVRRKNGHVQTLLSIGGRKADKSAFASMASNRASRESFIDSAIQLARSNGFHGIDLVWEYPSNGVEMSHFGTLLEEWRTALDDESERTEKVCLLLTAAVYYSSDYNSVSYPIQALKENLDWVNVIAYDFYGPGSSAVTGPAAALFDLPKPAGYLNIFMKSGPSGSSGLKKWIEAGLPEMKAVLGFPYVGWAWSLQNVNDHGYDAATTGAAITIDGSINYAQVRNFIVEHGAAVEHNPMVTGDYCYVGATWISYDDNQSIVRKVKFAKQTGLRGYFSWHVGADYDCGLSRAALRAWDATEPTTGA